MSDPSLEYGSVATSVAHPRRDRSCRCRLLQGARETSRSDNHHDAELLLEQITPGGKRAASQLRQLIDIKDTAHYGELGLMQAELAARIGTTAATVAAADSLPRDHS